MLGTLRLSLAEGFAILCDKWARQEEHCNDDIALVNSSLHKLSLRPMLTDIEAEALVLFRNCTAREAQFWRDHLGGLPSRQRLTAARDEILKLIPVIYVMRQGFVEWEVQYRPSTSLTSIEGRDISSAPFSLIESLTHHLIELRDAGK